MVVGDLAAVDQVRQISSVCNRARDALSSVDLNMIELDHALLDSVGLAPLPAHRKNEILAELYRSLEEHVALRIATRLSNDQLDEFEAFLRAGDDAGAKAWLDETCPQHENIIEEELEVLLTRLRDARDALLRNAIDPHEPSDSVTPISSVPATRPGTSPSP